MTIPFEQINETIDRAWTERLMSVLESSAENDSAADDAVDSLSELIDPAATDRLFAIGTDISKDSHVRARALTVIFESGVSLEGDELRQWWKSGDHLLQVEALQHAYRTEADYIRPVLQDPLHPLHRNALIGMEVGFDDAEWQSYVVSGLSHFDPEIQEIAAGLCVWQEPIAAEQKLIDLANGSDTDTAIRAIRTLEYFRSRRSLRALSELAEHNEVERADEARDAVIDLSNEFKAELGKFEGAPTLLDSWMKPVVDVVALNHQIDVSDPFSGFGREESASLPVHGQALASALLELGGQWGDKMQWLANADWTSETESDRRLLRGVLVNHVDPIVRKYAARILGAWNDVDGLLVLLHDKYIMVRRAALDWLGGAPKTPSIADDVWPLIRDDIAGEWYAQEALEAWLQHTNSDPTEQLVEIALNDTRTGLRWSAINWLGAENAGLLLPLLDQPAAVSWSLHSLLLGNLHEAGIKPVALDNFRDVDDLYIAAALALFDSP